MATIDTLTARGFNGNKVTINKANIFAINDFLDDGCGILPITIVSNKGVEIRLDLDENYDDLIRRWTA